MGDLIIWQQILANFSDSACDCVIFITDDKKDDWWLVVSGKTIGPRAELAEEISRLAGVKRFKMYDTSSVLASAQRYLQADIDDQSIKYAAGVLDEIHSELLNPTPISKDAVQFAVYSWISESIGGIINGAPNLEGYGIKITESHGGDLFVDVEYIYSSEQLPLLKSMLINYDPLFDNSNPQRLLVIVGNSAAMCQSLVGMMTSIEIERGQRANVAVGYMDFSNVWRFVPLRLFG